MATVSSQYEVLAVLYCNNTNKFLVCNSILLKRKHNFVQQLSTFMIQRIQSIYLLLAVIASGVLPFFLPLFTLKNGDVVTIYSNLAYIFLFVFSAALSILGIFSFKNRKKQFVFGRLNIILNFILLGLFIYLSLNLSGEADTEVSEKGIGMVLPLVSIVLISLANRAIKKDEDLVKSADRLR